MRDFIGTTMAKGNIGWVSDLRYTQSEQAVINFRLCANEKYRTQSGEERERKTWLRCVVFGDAAEYHAERLEKGAKYLVAGRYQIRTYEDQSGQNRESHEFVLNGPGCGLELISPPPKRERSKSQDAPAAAGESTDTTD